MIAAPSPDAHARALRLWLYAVAALVLAMVLVGGATRVTESGLSITEWRPVMGVVPPLTAGDWQAEFAKYQAIPQYRELNFGMTLDEFKNIYWWEWTHRLLGRLIGVAFLLPFLWFLWRGFVPRAARPRLCLIFGLGALQGAVGWWMVASGLAGRVEVSQYRLATHLILACLIYVAIIWTAQRLGDEPGAQAPIAPRRIRVSAGVLLVLVLGQIYLGALVAGLRAGLVYNTWPLIDGALVPDAAHLFFNTPLWRNFFENTMMVQFDHRMLAYVIFAGALVHLLDVAATMKSRSTLRSAAILFAAVALQAAVGVIMLLARTPLPLALLHQATAMLVLTAATVHAAKVARPVIASQRVRPEMAGPMTNSAQQSSAAMQPGLLRR
jgi:heme a synthase